MTNLGVPQGEPIPLTRDGIERFTKLAELLENFKEVKQSLVIKTTKFRMDKWHCDTAACAIGTAGSHPWFNQKGLYLQQDWDGDYSLVYEGRRDLYAVEQFFDINTETTDYLFLGKSYRRDRIKAKHVAERIRHLLKLGAYYPTYDY